MNRLGRKLTVLFLAGVITAVTGCSSGGGDTTVENPSSESGGLKTEVTQQEQTVIRYMTWEDSDWQKLTTKFIEEFEKENPDIKIEYEPVAGEGYQAKISAELASGSGPDVCWVDNSTTAFETGAYMPLDELMEAHNFNLGAYNQELLDMCSYDGSLYGLGGWLNTAMINYNKELFDAAGVPYPEAGWTWQDCYEAAEKITSGSGGDKTYGIYLENWTPSYENIAWNNGGALVDANNDYHVLNSQENAEALTFYTSFEKNGLSPDKSTVQANGGLIDMFNSGKIAMVYFFPNIVVSARSSDSFDLNKLGIVPMPVKEEGMQPSANFLFTNPISITSTCKNPDAAFRFLSALVGEVHQTEFCNLGYGLPSITNLVSDLGMDKDQHMGVFVDPLINPDKYVAIRTYSAFSPISSLIDTEIRNAISRVTENGQDAQEALDEVVKNLESQE